MSAFELLPWQAAPWGNIQSARQDGRLHHAFLIVGQAGIGKRRFARAIGHSLLCRNTDADGRPCGRCKDCHLFRVGNHTDFRWLQPEEDSKSGEIKVDAVRELAAADSLSAQSGGYKIIAIDPAERMNKHAANSLLKTLEEPAASSIYLLLSSRPQALLPTIRSRCQVLPITVPDEAQAVAWLRGQVDAGVDPLPALRLSGGAPLAALALLQREEMALRESLMQAFLRLAGGKGEPVALAAAWMKLDLPLLFDWMGGWVADMLRLGTASTQVRLNNPDRAEVLARAVVGLEPVKLHRFWQRLTQARRQLETSNLQPQLLLESLLCEWSELADRAR